MPTQRSHRRVTTRVLQERERQQMGISPQLGFLNSAIREQN